MLLRVIDFETTGFPPDAAIVEIGWQDVDVTGVFPAPGGFTLVNPGRPIPPEASAVHHLIDDDVKDAPTPELALMRLHGADIYVAHNAAFERAFFDGLGKPWICTMKVARRAWPEAPSHSNQALRYWRKLAIGFDRAAPPHRAAPDAYVTALLLSDLLRDVTVDDMVKWSSEPSLLPRVTFGKHRGKEWADLPRDYLEWLAFRSEMDEDTKFTARHHLEARR